MVAVPHLVPALLRLPVLPFLHGGEGRRLQRPAEVLVDGAHGRPRIVDQVGVAHVAPALPQLETGFAEAHRPVEHAAHECELLRTEGAGLGRLADAGTDLLHQAAPGAHELPRLAVGGDEARVRIGGGERLQLHEMDRRLQQPLRLLPGPALAALPSVVLHGAAVVRVGAL